MNLENGGRIEVTDREQGGKNLTVSDKDHNTAVVNLTRDENLELARLLTVE